MEYAPFEEYTKGGMGMGGWDFHKWIVDKTRKYRARKQQKPATAGMVVGGKYAPKGKSVERARKMFTASLAKRGHSAQEIDAMWNVEQEEPAKLDMRTLGKLERYSGLNKRNSTKPRKPMTYAQFSKNQPTPYTKKYIRALYNAYKKELKGGIYAPKGLTKDETAKKYFLNLEKKTYRKKPVYSLDQINELWEDEQNDPSKLDLRKIAQVARYSALKKKTRKPSNSGYREIFSKHMKGLKKEKEETLTEYKERRKEAMEKVSAEWAEKKGTPNIKEVEAIEELVEAPERLEPLTFPKWKSEYVDEHRKDLEILKPKQKSLFLKEEYQLYKDNRFKPGYWGTGY